VNRHPFILFFMISLISFSARAQNVTHLPDFDYDLTDIKGIASVDELYESLRSDVNFDPHRSNCLYRANIWSYQMLKTNQIKSGKVFLFYTWSPKSPSSATYGITGEGWWFHVAPYVVFDGKEYVLEKTEKATQPMLLEDWEKLHTNGSTCRELQVPQDKELYSFLKTRESITLVDVPCYIRKTPMNYMSPRDVYNKDILNTPVTLTEPEIYWACRETMSREQANSGKGKFLNYKQKCDEFMKDPSVQFDTSRQRQ
jgi:hypothetical protein